MAENTRYEFSVSPKVTFLADQSDPDKNHYVFAYTITVTNTGSVAAQLVSRHWIITDAENRVQEVKGQGVVGKQPVLRPGESFSYTSGCPLTTPDGSMQGFYAMQDEGGAIFDVEVPLFPLDSPYVKKVLH